MGIQDRMKSLRMTPDTVVLEIAVAEIDLEQADEFDDFWSEVDASSIGFEARRLLDQNGLRAGLISSNVPARLQKLLVPRAIDSKRLDSWQAEMLRKGLLKPDSRLMSHDRVQNRLGETHPTRVSPTRREANWVVHDRDREMPGAAEFVQAWVELKTFPKGDGTVRLLLTPALYLGQPRTRIGVRQDSFAWVKSHDVRQLGELQFEANLRNGETLLLTSTRDLGDLGGLFFGNPDPGPLSLADKATSPGAENRKGQGNFADYEFTDEDLEMIAEVDALLDEADFGLDESSSDANRHAAPDTFRIYMVRVIQTQMDDLFDPKRRFDKLSSTSLD